MLYKLRIDFAGLNTKLRYKSMEKQKYLTSIPYGVEMRSPKWSVLARLRPALIADLVCIFPFGRKEIVRIARVLHLHTPIDP